MDRDMDRGNYKMRMVNMKVVGKKGKCMDRVLINGRMEGNIMVNGLMGKCMGGGNTVGQMVGNMKEAIKSISNKVMEFIHGQMADHIVDNGFRENNMEKVCIRI